MGLWDWELSDEDARKRTLAFGLNFTLPSVFLKPATSAANASKGGLAFNECVLKILPNMLLQMAVMQI